MNKRAVIAMLKQHRAELERKGVRHAALFGSLARDEARPDSDIDIMIELDPRHLDRRVRVCRAEGLYRCAV